MQNHEYLNQLFESIGRISEFIFFYAAIGVDHVRTLVGQMPASMYVALAVLLSLYLLFYKLLLSVRERVSRSRAAKLAATPPPGSEISAALSSCSKAWIGLALFSGVVNVLALTGSIFMLEVYDRVLPSRSIPTLVALAGIAGVVFLVQGSLDVIRSRIMTRVAAYVDQSLNARIYRTLVQLPLKGGSNVGLQPLRDLDSIRAFLSGQGPLALFDLPWIPLYLALIFAFHYYLGLAALAGTIVLAILAFLTDRWTHVPMNVAAKFGVARHAWAETSRRNSEVIAAMGMEGHIGRRWAEANDNYLHHQRIASDVSMGLGGLSRVLRQILQSAVLAIGAYLVIRQEATGGIIIAGSILTARALAPVDQAIANWKGFVAARHGKQRLDAQLKSVGLSASPLELNPPKARLSLEAVSAVVPATSKLVVHDVSFALKSGQALGIVGPSASGKTSLVRLIVGAWQPARGMIRLDGASLTQWSAQSLGAHIGYLPQDVELLPGTIAENISRFHPDATPGATIAAAETAKVHDLIVTLPDGYETKIGENGSGLSAGQQQRVALARALYGDPFLVVLDEPNSNLDAEGDRALVQAIMGVRARGGIVIVVAHRESALAAVDTLLALVDGRVHLFGPKDEVLGKLRPPAPVSFHVRSVAAATEDHRG